MISFSTRIFIKTKCRVSLVVKYTLKGLCNFIQRLQGCTLTSAEHDEEMS